MTAFVFQVKERLSIIQNRKAEEDLLGLKHTDRIRHLTQDLPQVNILRESVCMIFLINLYYHQYSCILGGQEQAENGGQRAT